jgi:hypothetical protein
VERGHIDDVIEPAETRRCLVADRRLYERKRGDSPPKDLGNILRRDHPAASHGGVQIRVCLSRFHSITCGCEYTSSSGVEKVVATDGD